MTINKRVILIAFVFLGLALSGGAEAGISNKNWFSVGNDIYEQADFYNNYLYTTAPRFVLDINGNKNVAYLGSNNYFLNFLKIATFNVSSFKWEVSNSNIKPARSYGDTDDKIISLASSRLVNDNSLFVSYLDNNDSDKPKVVKFSNGNWTNVGGAILDSEAKYVKLAIDSNNVIYVAYKDVATEKVSVKKFNGSSWELVGAAGFTLDTQALSDFKLDNNNVPYVALIDYGTGSKSTVMSFVNNAWAVVGSSDFSPNYGMDILVLDFDNNNIPYVAFDEQSNNNKIAVMKFESNWAIVSTSSLQVYHSPSGGRIAIDFNSANELFVAYTDYSTGKAMLKKLVAGSLTSVGVSGFSSGNAKLINLVIDENDNPYVSYADDELSENVVMRYSRPEILFSNRFSESNLNDGSISSSTTISLEQGGTFENVGGVLSSSSYLIENLPAGLTSSITVGDDGKTATLTLSGKAIYHNNANDVSNLSITFYNSAFSDYLASDYFNPTSNLTIDFRDELASQWQQVGDFFSDRANYKLSMAVSGDGSKYLAYSDVVNQLGFVKKFNNSSSTWDLVGGVSISTTVPNSISVNLASNGNPFVAYSDSANSYKINVKEFDGEAWNLVGEAGFSSGETDLISLAFVGNTPYVAYQDRTLLDKVTVKKFTGAAWELVGEAGFSSGGANELKLVTTDNGILYLVYQDKNNQATVMKFSNNEWTNIGVLGASCGNDIVLDNQGLPYVAYSDVDNSYKITVKKFNGTTWSLVGAAGFTNLDGDFVKIVLDSNENPYVAFSDYDADKYTSVMKFDGSSWNYFGQKGFSGYDVTGSINFSVDDNNNLYVAQIKNVNYVTKASVDKFELYPKVSSLEAALNNGKVSLNWDIDQGEVYDHVIKYRLPNTSSWTTYSHSRFVDNSKDVSGISTAGNYEFSVNAVNPSGINSKPIIASIFVPGSNYTVEREELNNLVTTNIIVPANGSNASTTAINFNWSSTVVPFSGALISIPSGVTMTASSTFSVADLSAGLADVSDLTAINTLGSLKFGLPNLGLSLSQPIDIEIPVAGVATSTVLTVFTKTAGSAWESLTTCAVSNEICSFSVTHLSEFAAGTTISDDSDTNSGSTFVAPVCSEVVYYDFQDICSDGYQYRNIVSKSPENCSLTAAQIEATRRLCVLPKPTVTEETSKDLLSSYLEQEKLLVKKINSYLAKRLSGKILLQVEDKGRAWYVNPLNNLRYYLGSPADAYNLMRKLALGISNDNFSKFKNNTASANLAGRILLKVEDKGEAYYVNPTNLKLYYLGRPSDAFAVMRNLGLGISNENIYQLGISEVK